MKNELAVPATELLEQECWSLLREASVGRLAVWHGGGPDIFPINYTTDHGTVIFRTGSGTKLEAALIWLPGSPGSRRNQTGNRRGLECRNPGQGRAADKDRRGSQHILAAVVSLAGRQERQLCTGSPRFNLGTPLQGRSPQHVVDPECGQQTLSRRITISSPVSASYQDSDGMTGRKNSPRSTGAAREVPAPDRFLPVRHPGLHTGVKVTLTGLHEFTITGDQDAKEPELSRSSSTRVSPRDPLATACNGPHSSVLALFSTGARTTRRRSPCRSPQ